MNLGLVKYKCLRWFARRRNERRRHDTGESRLVYKKRMWIQSQLNPNGDLMASSIAPGFKHTVLVGAAHTRTEHAMFDTIHPGPELKYFIQTNAAYLIHVSDYMFADYLVIVTNDDSTATIATLRFYDEETDCARLRRHPFKLDPAF